MIQTEWNTYSTHRYTPDSGRIPAKVHSIQVRKAGGGWLKRVKELPDQEYCITKEEGLAAFSSAQSHARERAI